MPPTNHEALGQGLKLYTDTMRELIRNRLAAAMSNNWWEQGVLHVLPRRQSDSLKLDRERDPGLHPGGTARTDPLPHDRGPEPGRIRGGLPEVPGGGLVPQRRGPGAERLGASPQR